VAENSDGGEADAAALAEAEAASDAPDEGWSLLTVAPSLPASISVQRASRVFAAAAPPGAASVPPANVQVLQGGQAQQEAEGEDYLDAVVMDWRRKRT
jgi:hypothetical protein